MCAATILNLDVMQSLVGIIKGLISFYASAQEFSYQQKTKCFSNSFVCFCLLVDFELNADNVCIQSENPMMMWDNMTRPSSSI